MIIIGAKGFAKELLEILIQLDYTESIAFFDNVTLDSPNFLYDKFPILKNEAEVKSYFKNHNNRFALGIGKPNLRHKLADLFQQWGGELVTLTSPKASIGSFNTEIGVGSTIMTGTIITNDVKIGNGCLINLNCTIGHDSEIGNYSELCPGVHISGNSKIGDFVFIGTGAVILPNITIEDYSIVGANAVVTKNVSANSVVKGIPAK